MLGHGDGFLRDYVQQTEQHLSGGTIVTEINLARMNGVVADNANDIESLLNARVEPACNQRSNIVIDIFAMLAKLLAELLNGQAQQGRRSPRREVENGAGLVIIQTYVFGQIRIRWRSFASARMNETVVDPDRQILAVEALRKVDVVQLSTGIIA